MENIKIKRTASAVDIILKILQGFIIAGICVCVIFIPLMAIFGEKMVASASNIELGAITFKLMGGKTEYLNMGSFKLCLIGMLAAVAVILAIGWYFVRVLRQILAPMKEGRPFEAGVSQKIRKLGWITLIGGAFTSVAGSIATILELKCYDLNAVFSSPAIESFSFNNRIGLGFIAAALLIFFLSFVFRSGEELQKESDETL